MTEKAKRRMFYALFFFTGAGFGTGAGFILNDYVEREDPDAVQQIQQQFETQNQLDDFFASERAAAADRQAEGSE
ncbi:MAG: hypothetical protein KC561_01750 [Myxococcales bacterium]|nr:hypothetical protein [Myxococcales bacterium]